MAPVPPLSPLEKERKELSRNALQRLVAIELSPLTGKAEFVRLFDAAFGNTRGPALFQERPKDRLIALVIKVNKICGELGMDSAKPDDERVKEKLTEEERKLYDIVQEKKVKEEWQLRDTTVFARIKELEARVKPAHTEIERLRLKLREQVNKELDERWDGERIRRYLDREYGNPDVERSGVDGFVDTALLGVAFKKGGAEFNARDKERYHKYTGIKDKEKSEDNASDPFENNAKVVEALKAEIDYIVHSSEIYRRGRRMQEIPSQKAIPVKGLPLSMIVPENEHDMRFQVRAEPMEGLGQFSPLHVQHTHAPNYALSA